jgi:hypothetical protein
MIRCLLSFFFIGIPSLISAQDVNGVVKKEITVEGYRFLLTYDTAEYFTGTMKVIDEVGRKVFEADGFYSYCYSDTLVDLNDDGSKEVIFGMATGMSPYQTGSLIVFDPASGDMTPFEIINGELVNSNDGNHYVKVYVRMSPAYLGAFYYYLLEYKDGKLILPDPKDSSFPSYLIDSQSDYFQEAISDYALEMDECNDDANYFTLFEAYAVQAKLTGREDFAGEFFRKNYKCVDANVAYELINKSVDEMYTFIMSQDYKFQSD